MKCTRQLLVGSDDHHDCITILTGSIYLPHHSQQARQCSCGGWQSLGDGPKYPIDPYCSSKPHSYQQCKVRESNGNQATISSRYPPIVASVYKLFEGHVMANFWHWRHIGKILIVMFEGMHFSSLNSSASTYNWEKWQKTTVKYFE